MHMSADEKITIVNRLNNKVVTMEFHFIAEKETDVVIKRSKKDGNCIEVERPKIANRVWKVSINMIF